MSRFTQPIQTAAYKVGDTLRSPHFGHEAFDAKFKAWREKRGLGNGAWARRANRKPMKAA